MTPRTLLVVVLVTLASSSDAGERKPAPDHLTDGKEFAKQQGQSIEQRVREGTLDESIPGYTGESSPLVDLYSTESDGAAVLQRSARRHAEGDPAAQYIMDAYGKRPYYAVDPQTDPLMRHVHRITDAADALGTQRTSCQTLSTETQGVATSTESCEVTVTRRLKRPSCTRTLELSCDYGSYYRGGCTADWMTINSVSSDMTWRYEDGALTFGVQSDNTWNASCALFHRTLSFELKPQYMDSLRLRRIEYDDWAVVRFNGHYIYFGPRADMNTCEIHNDRVIYHWQPGRIQTDKCDLGQNWRVALDVDLLRFARDGENTLELTVAVGGGGEGYLEIEALTPLRETRTEQCDDGFEPQGRTPIMVFCAERGTKEINGWPVHRCWRWRMLYRYLEPPEHEESAACERLRARGCEQIGTECKEHTQEGHCARHVLQFRCYESGDETQVEMCPELLTCPDGDCATEYQSTHDATEDFQAAATHLTVAMEAAQQLDPELMRTFSGEALSCHNAGLNFANCCRSSGWGVDAHLTRCSAEEHRLGIARAQGQAHFVGRIRSGFLGMTRRRVYCVYPSPLARIVVQQGKRQLGQGFGGARNPDCSGFTTTELERLDFDAMDLSEFYDYTLARAQGGTVPNQEQLTNQLREKVKRINSGQETMGND